MKATEKCPYCGKPSKVWTEVKILRAANAAMRHQLREKGVEPTEPQPSDQVVGVQGFQNENKFDK